MNSVHEQCPNIDSETILSPKTGSKLSQVHNAPDLAQPTLPSARAHGRVVLSPLASCRRPLAIHLAAHKRLCHGSVPPAPAPGRGLASRPCRDIAPASAYFPLSQYTAVYCDTLLSHPSCLNHDTNFVS